jgi:cytochrome d ubiquinol oxidase subunit II
MHAAWFAILALMLTAYAVLDGFDFGAGIVHVFVARSDEERRTVLSAIGPLWDGNEVWLIASGGAFVFAFPRAYAAAFSGLYLALMLVLWLLVLRGVAIEFRSKADNPLWRTAWDGVFASASAAMAVVLGVALGNVVRGVPLDASGYFHEDLFAVMGAAHAGAIDPFTAVFGAFALSALGAHGATFLAWKTEGPVRRRSLAAARWLWGTTLVLGAAETLFTATAQPQFFRRVLGRPWLWPLPPVAVAGAGVAIRSLRFGGGELRGFLGSCTFLTSMLLATAGALYPTLLKSTVDEAFSLDAYNAASGERGLEVGLYLWAPAIALAVGYFWYLFRSFRGKVRGAEH